jgi:choline dehydrogenase-like flavoprotein
MNEAQKQVLSALADTLINEMSDVDREEMWQWLVSKSDSTGGVDDDIRDAFQWFASCRGSNVVGLLARVESIIFDDKSVPLDNRHSLLQVFDVLASDKLAWLLTGVSNFGRSFAALPLDERVSVFRNWGNSPLSAVRGFHKSIRALVFKEFFSMTERTGAAAAAGKRMNRFWPLIGYEGEDPSAPSMEEAARDRYRFEMMALPESGDVGDDGVLELRNRFDAVVVGSGCGGGVMAAELAAAGLRVLVLDKGAYVHESEMTLLEEDAFAQLYEQSALLSSADAGVAVLAGSVFGGGSTVNWACSLRTPYYVLREWAERYGVEHAVSGELARSLDAVCARVNVTEGDAVVHDAQNEIMLRGCARLGYPVRVAGQNVRSDDGHRCGSCCFGCRRGEKQGTMVTFLRDAAECGAKFMCSTRVERVLVGQSGRAYGVAATHGGRQFRVHAPIVCAAAGALHTPLLLRRSGLKNRWIGANLRLHPVSAVVGLFDEPVHAWRGPMMTTVCEVAARGVDGSHYGAKLECPALHPGLSGATLSFTSPSDTKRQTLLSAHRASIIVLGRDKGAGSVAEQPNSDGRLVRIDYTVAKHDRESLLAGMRHACAILIAAGAKEITAAVHGVPPCLVDTPQRGTDAPSFDAWFARVRAAFRVNQAGFFSAHQMGTARMASTPQLGAVDVHGQTHEVEGLYVCDTSLFPTPSGVNPMLTVFSLSHLIAQHIVRFHRSRPRAKL